MKYLLALVMIAIGAVVTVFGVKGLVLYSATPWLLITAIGLSIITVAATVIAVMVELKKNKR